MPISKDIVDSAKLPVFWGDQELQGLHVGFFVALAALVVFWAAPQPHDARLRGARGRLQPGGGALRRHQRAEEPDPRDGDLRRVRRPRRRRSTCSATSTASACPTSRSRAVGFLGIAVALLGRNTAVGVGSSALLFGALLFGTNHGLQSSEIDPGLASNLTYMIQGLIVLFVGADVLILYIWSKRRTPPARRDEPQKAVAA